MSTTQAVQPLRLGIIGLSEGNGHPYSWAAIFNGYHAQHMAACPFPVIPQYLGQRSFPADAIGDARVTHIWTQERAISEQVAAAALIPTIVDDYTDMIGQVDALLLARDDPEQHLAMSAPFLDAGLPVYIDKPVAADLATLDAIYRHQRYPGQIFSCSALRYAPEFALSAEHRAALGEIRLVQAEVPNSWHKYAVHIIDPVLTMLGLDGASAAVNATTTADGRVVCATWDGVSAVFTSTGALPAAISIRLVGTRGSRTMVFADAFPAFKRALEVFVEGVRSRTEMISRADLAGTVSIIERGAR